MNYCSICGSELDNNGRCKNCGNQGSFESTVNEVAQGLSQKDYDTLEKIYIGNNYVGIEDSKLSFSSLLFGPIYALYRKLYFIGIVWLFIIVLLLLNFSVYVVLFINLFLNIIMFFMFNSLYLKIVDKKINKIVDKHTNYTLEELKRLCAKNGRTSPTFIVLFIIIGILLLLNYSVMPLLIEKINTPKVAVNESSAENYIRSVNLVMATQLLNDNNASDGIYKIEEDGSISIGNKNYRIDISISHPNSGELNIQSGNVVNGEISYGNTTYIYDGKISLKK